MEQGHCGACRRKWRLTDTDLCPCGETQTMFHIVESCPLTKLNGSLSWLHSVDEDAVLWLTSYGSWRSYEKKKNRTYDLCIIIIFIISGFGIYGAAIVPDSGVGNTWQRLTLVLHEFLSNGLTPSRFVCLYVCNIFENRFSGCVCCQRSIWWYLVQRSFH